MGYVLDIYFNGKRVKERVKGYIFEEEEDVFKFFEYIKNRIRYPVLVDDRMYAQARGVSSRDYPESYWDTFFVHKLTYNPELSDMDRKKKTSKPKIKLKRKPKK